MRIVKRDEFLKMPPNTVFSKYEPCCVYDISILMEPYGTNDFAYQDIASAIESTGSGDFFDQLSVSQEDGIELFMDFDCCSRDGCFDESQLFAVWSKVDVSALIERLKMCL